MVYITVLQPPMYHQMSLEEFLFGTETASLEPYNPNMTNTRTYTVDAPSDRVRSRIDVYELIEALRRFNASVEPLREVPRQALYREFYIPKKSGGLRKIDAPNEDLMNALRVLKTIFENKFKVLYHTSAFAYIRKRSTLDAVKRHQANESKWFAKFDLSNFFGSTTPEFVMKMFSMIYPFSEVVRYRSGREELSKALELAFLNGGLPQGTPISPLITNVMMIPIDHCLANAFRDLERQRYIYTRYADDFIVSSRYEFDFRKIQQFIIDALKRFDAPFTIKTEKTRYGSSAGRNWNLGVMLNKDNKITIGSKRKREFQAMLTSFALDTKNGNPWPLEQVQHLEGLRNYYHMVEGTAIDDIVTKIGDKFSVNIPQTMKQLLRG